MEVGGSEDILMERIAIIFIHPYLNRTISYRWCFFLIFFTNMIISSRRLRGNEISKENLMISKRNRYKMRDKCRSGDIIFLHIQSMSLLCMCLQFLAYFFILKISLPYSRDIWLFWAGHDLMSIKVWVQKWLRIFIT